MRISEWFSIQCWLLMISEWMWTPPFSISRCIAATIFDCCGSSKTPSYLDHHWMGICYSVFCRVSGKNSIVAHEIPREEKPIKSASVEWPLAQHLGRVSLPDILKCVEGNGLNYRHYLRSTHFPNQIWKKTNFRYRLISNLLIWRSFFLEWIESQQKRVFVLSQQNYKCPLFSPLSTFVVMSPNIST